jgi:hypothetical protein
LTDFDSTMYGESMGTASESMAMRGLPQASSQVCSYAVHTSAPVNGSMDPMPMSARWGARGTANRSAGSYRSG